MGWYYRKRRGNVNLSFSRRGGPRVSIGVGGRGGCLLPLAVILVLGLIAAR